MLEVVMGVTMWEEVGLFASGLHASHAGACDCLPLVSSDLEGKKAIKYRSSGADTEIERCELFFSSTKAKSNQFHPCELISVCAPERRLSTTFLAF